MLKAHGIYANKSISQIQFGEIPRYSLAWVDRAKLLYRR